MALYIEAAALWLVLPWLGSKPLGAEPEPYID